MQDTTRPEVALPGEVTRHAVTLRGLVGRVEPESVTPGEASEMWTGFDRIERLAGAAKLRLAARVEESGEWERAGCRSAAEHMARQSGGSQRGAQSALTASKRLAKCPGVEAALRAGELSVDQAEIIASAVVVDPSCETYLLGQAQRAPVFRLAEMAGQIRAANDPNPTKTYERIRSERRLRQRTDPEGAWHLFGHGPADDGALFNHALGPLIDELFDQARAEGRHEHRDALVWDALHEMIRRYLDSEDNLPGTSRDDGDTGTAPQTRKRSRSNRRYMTLVKVDVDKLRDTEDPQGRYVEMPGVGTIPLSVAEAMFPESILYLVLARGVDVVNVTNLSRCATVAQQVKLLWEQGRCSNEACGRTYTQTDHRNPWARVHCTHSQNLDELCPFCHRLKTYEGWELVEGIGPRAFVSPDDVRHPRYKRKADAA